MAIGSEVFGSYDEEIDVSVKLKNGVAWIRCGWNYLGFVLAGKAAQDWRNRWVVVPGIGSAFRCLGCD